MVRGVLYGLVAACLMATPAAAEPLPAPSVVQDLTFARDVWAVRERSFSPEARTRMLAFLGDQIAHARPMERTELALVFSEAQAMSGNDHTQSRSEERRVGKECRSRWSPY